jgi:hypothetical protein
VSTFDERELGDGGDLLTSALARAAALARARARCRGVAVPARVRRRPDGVVTYEEQAAPGSSLAVVLDRAPLTVGQCVTVGVGIAEALAAIHAERLAHGAVRAASVVVDGRRVALTHTMVALEAGGASPARDVQALGELLRSLANAAAAPIIHAWTAPLLGETPGERPTAAHAAAALARCAPQERVHGAPAPVAAAMRASVVDPVEPWPQDRWWRIERRALRLAPVVGLAAVAAVAAAMVVPSVAAAPLRLSQGPTTPPTAAQAPAGSDAVVRADLAAEELTRQRIAARAAGDGDLLLRVSRPGSATARSDAELATALSSGDVTFSGLELTGVDASVESETPGGVIVEVTSDLSGYGVGHERRPAGTATARLELVLTDGRWLVEQILPPP